MCRMNFKTDLIQMNIDVLENQKIESREVRKFEKSDAACLPN